MNAQTTRKVAVWGLAAIVALAVGPARGQTVTKTNNLTPTASNVGSTDGRLPLGLNTTGDDAHVYTGNVIKDGSTYKMWYSGHDGTYIRIYLATSPDGLTWTKYTNAIPGNSNVGGTLGRIPLGSSGGDTSYAFGGWVIKEGGTYKMWYSGYNAANYRIYCATSYNGLAWTKITNAVPTASNSTGTKGRIPIGTSGGDMNGVAYPTVVRTATDYKCGTRATAATPSGESSMPPRPTAWTGSSTPTPFPPTRTRTGRTAASPWDRAEATAAA